MGIGFLTVQTRTAEDALPVISHVVITAKDGTVLYKTVTDASGNTEEFPLSAPDKELTLDPDYRGPAYSVCDVTVSAKGYIPVHIRNVEVFDTQTSILPVRMVPATNSNRGYHFR